MLERAARLRSNSVSSEREINCVLLDAAALEKDLYNWSVSQPKEWRPKTLFVDLKQCPLAQDLGWLPRKVEVYSDCRLPCREDNDIAHR